MADGQQEELKTTMLCDTLLCPCMVAMYCPVSSCPSKVVWSSHPDRPQITTTWVFWKHHWGGRVFRMMTCRAEVYAGKRRSYNDGPGGSSSLLEVLVVSCWFVPFIWACCFALLLVPLCRAVGSEFTNCTSQAPLFPLKINPLNFTFGATETECWFGWFGWSNWLIAGLDWTEWTDD